MFVTASTKEECEAVMESYEDAIRADGIQDCFDSNLEAEFDEKKNAWVGAVEVYVGNDYVADEKEAIKEVYMEWKRNLKATQVVVETPAPEAEIEITEEIEKAVVHCDKVEGALCEECAFDKCNKESFELVLKKVKEKTLAPEAPATGYVNQEERVQSKKDRLVVGKTYSVDDGAGTKMQIIKKENSVWWGTEGLWNLFNSFNLDYQEYILDLIPEEKIKKCIRCKWYTACYNSDERYREEIYDEETTKVCEDYKE